MLNNYLELLESLVNIDSGTGDQEGLKQVAAIIQDRVTKVGFDFRILTGKDGSTHYLATRGSGARVLLMAHLDTVFPKGTATKHRFRIEGARAYGPGVSDCKSGVVTIVGALEMISQTKFPDLEIACLFNTDEEISSPGSRALIEAEARNAKMVLVIEPAEEDMVTISRKGIGRFDLQVVGKAAHSGSNPQDGANAILELAHKIIAIQNLTDLKAGITLNTGVIGGGFRPNVVPDYAAAEIDLRIVSPEQEGLILPKLEEIVKQQVVAGTSAKLCGGITRPPMQATVANLALFERLKLVAGELGLNLDKNESGGGSDANFTAALGIPTLDGLGPTGGGHHSEAEYLVIDSLVERIELLGMFLMYSF